MSNTRRYNQNLEHLRRSAEHKRRERQTLESNVGPTSRRVPDPLGSGLTADSSAQGRPITDSTLANFSSLPQPGRGGRRWDQTAMIIDSDSDESGPVSAVNSFGRITRKPKPMITRTPASIFKESGSGRGALRGGVPIRFDDPGLNAAYDAAARKPQARAARLGVTEVAAERLGSTLR